MKETFCWCRQCQHPIFTVQPASCPTCGSTLVSLTTDARPVFARERRILEFYGYGPLTNEAVWRSSKSPSYYINGTSVYLPDVHQLKRDGTHLAAYIHDKDRDDYDALDQALIQEYQRHLAVNQSRRCVLEAEAFQFIEHTAQRFSKRVIMVSFSGGKDSTVVSDLVRRGLGRSDILHVFGDTTLEDDNTYAYVHLFQEQNPHIPFFHARAEHNFHDLVEEIGPPSRVMRWCCTIFKTGPIYSLMQGFGKQKILTFYGIRRNESSRRSQYHKLSWNDPDHLGKVVQVEQDDELNGVTVGAKIGLQATASPIIDWTEFDVWNYMISRNLVFNASYRLGYSRVGCWLCPMNSEWSELLATIFFPDDAAHWRTQLVDFARRIGKPDPEEYVDARAWAKRFGGAGLSNSFRGIDTRPCGSQANSVQIEIERPVTPELEAFLTPLGKINRDRSRAALGEIYLEGRPNQDWDALIVQAPVGSTTLRFTVINPKQDMRRLTWYFKQQATKFQTCIQCTACSAVCPHGAVTIKPDMRVYEIDQDVCVGCMECVTHFGSTGCLVAKSLSVFGRSRSVDV